LIEDRRGSGFRVRGSGFGGDREIRGRERGDRPCGGGDYNEVVANKSVGNRFVGKVCADSCLNCGDTEVK
jgi:hypothetical protein